MNKGTLKTEIEFIYNDLVEHVLSEDVAATTTAPYGDTEVISSTEYSLEDINRAEQDVKEMLKEIVEGLGA